MIQFTDQDSGYLPSNRRQVKKWLQHVMEREGKKPGEITYIFCTDASLSEMNDKYLKHKTLTDIITFDYSEKERLSGDIFISVERVRENAGKFNCTFIEEMKRVMVHGILHLSGYEDKSAEEKVVMRRKEEESLALWDDSVGKK